MDRQQSDAGTRAQADRTAAEAHKLDLLEQLRLGHGILSREQFEAALLAGDMEVWSLPFSQYALMAWGACAEGKVANILTTVGSMAYAAAGLAAIERVAKDSGANVVMSVGRVAWTRLVQEAGYEVSPAIIMKKVLHAN